MVVAPGLLSFCATQLLPGFVTISAHMSMIWPPSGPWLFGCFSWNGSVLHLPQSCTPRSYSTVSYYQQQQLSPNVGFMHSAYKSPPPVGPAHSSLPLAARNLQPTSTCQPLVLHHFSLPPCLPCLLTQTNPVASHHIYSYTQSQAPLSLDLNPLTHLKSCLDPTLSLLHWCCHSTA